MKRSIGAILGIVASAALATAACTGSGGGGKHSGGSGGGTLVMVQTGDPGTLDITQNAVTQAETVAVMSYDPLVYKDPDSGKFLSGIAQSWKVTPTSVVFKLHPNVKCSDGSPYRPSDAAQEINYIEKPANGSSVLGARIPDGLTATADNSAGTVTVTSKSKNAFLLTDFTDVFMVCKKGLDDHNYLKQHTIGTGPWVLTEAVPNSHYTFVRNAHYGTAPGGGGMTGSGVPSKVTIKIIDDATTITNLALNGQANIVAVQGQNAARLRAAGIPQVQKRLTYGETYFNEQAGRPGHDPTVRKALITGTDIDALTKVAGGEPSKGLVALAHPCSGDTVSGNLPTYDPNKAKQILADGGWLPGSGGVRAKNGEKLAIKFIYLLNNGAQTASAAELLAKQWDALGAKVTLQGITQAQFTELAFKTSDWDAGWISIQAAQPTTVMGFVSGPTPPHGTNFGFIHNASYDSLAKKALASPTLKQACSSFNQAETALFKNYDVIPMFDYPGGFFTKDSEIKLYAEVYWPSSIRLKHS